MDARTQAFLEAVVGLDGAQALAKATSRSEELEWAIFPRVVMAWLEVQDAYHAPLPGVADVTLTLAKGAAGFAGSINIGPALYEFQDASLLHVAGSVAVALAGPRPEAPPLHSAALSKLGRSVDLLVKARTLRKALQAPPRQPGYSPAQAGVQDAVGQAKQAAVAAHAASRRALADPGDLGRNHKEAVAAHTVAGDAYAAAVQQAAAPTERKALEKERQHHEVSGDFHYHMYEKQSGNGPVAQWWAGASELPDFETIKGVLRGAKYALVRPVTTEPAKKAEDKPGVEKKPPGSAALPQAPMAPLAPTPTQPKGASQVGTEVAGNTRQAGANVKAKQPGARPTPKKPSVKVTKAEAQTACEACGGTQFKGDRYAGCLCFASLAKAVTTTVTPAGYLLEFGPAWDADAITTLAETLGK